MDHDDPKFRITPVQQAAASCSGAIITSLLVTPLDVVKIRLQAQEKAASKCFLYCNGLMDHFCGCGPENHQKHWFQRPGHFNGTIDAFIKITRNEGFYSLWSGLSPTLVLAIPTTILYFVSYEQLRLRLKTFYYKSEEHPRNQALPVWIPLISGATARVVAVTIVSPLELIRTKMQSRKLTYAELKESLKFLIQQSGVFGLWKGVFPTLYRDVPFSAIYWMNYEFMKSAMCASITPTFSESFIAGAVSGAVAATVTVPFDVVKTHQQIEFGEKTLYTDKPKATKTTIEVFKDIYKHRGYQGLFAGLVPRLIKVAPACAIMISSFEYGKIFFYRHNKFMFEEAASLNEIPDFYNEELFPPDV